MGRAHCIAGAVCVLQNTGACVNSARVDPAAPAPYRQSLGNDGTLRILTINTHKGQASWNRRFMLAELRDAVRSTAADIVFLQEVIGHDGEEDATEPALPHYEFLADSLWPEYAYGRNAVESGRNHGNALLSRHRIRTWRNHDVSVRGLDREPRGLLHCLLDLDDGRELHAICVHLGLRESQRKQQLRHLCALISKEVPQDAPLVVAGDFNDWRERADAKLSTDCALHSVFAVGDNRCPRTFPARFPLLRLDRIYVRGLAVQSACVLSTLPWPHLSDHLPLLAEVKPGVASAA